MTLKSTVALPEEPDLAPANELLPAVLRLLRIMRYRRKVLLATLYVTALAGGAYYLLATRWFESSAKLLIIEQKQEQLSSVGDHDSTGNTMATHRELVKSPVVIQKAIGILAPEHRIDLQTVPPRDWVEEVASNLSTGITRKTNFIDVSYRSRQPEAAAAVVRAVIQSYLQFVEETHKGTASEVIDVLTHERNRLEKELRAKQEELQHSRQQVGHLAVSVDDSIVEPVIQKAIRLNDALLDVQEKRLELQATLASVEGALQRGEDINQYLMSIEATVGRQMLLASMGLSAQDLKLLGDQQQKLLDAQEELQSLSAFYGPNHPRITELNQQILSLRQYLSAYGTDAEQRYDALSHAAPGNVILDLLRQSVQQIHQREVQLQQAYDEARAEASGHSNDIVALQMLQREVDRLETQYGLLFEKIATVDIRQVQAPIQATVVREPLPAVRPISPQLRTVILFSLFGGLVLGAVIAYVQDFLDDRFTSPEELTTQLGVPMLAMVRALDPLPGEGLASVHSNALPNSVETEAFRTLRTALTLSSYGTDRILISSPEPSDGKTTIVVNLAVAFAKSGKKTLMIDADLRRPGMTALLSLKGTPGVSDALVSTTSTLEAAQQFVMQTEVEGLDVLPAGQRRPDPSELLTSQEFVELLAWADSQYDQVLVDCPPVLAVSDAQIVGRLVDGAVLVVRPHKNHRRLVLRAVENFHDTGCQVLGVVANGISADSDSYGYGYGYDYGYGYGQDEKEATDQDQTTDDMNWQHPARPAAEPTRPRKAA